MLIVRGVIEVRRHTNTAGSYHVITQGCEEVGCAWRTGDPAPSGPRLRADPSLLSPRPWQRCSKRDPSRNEGDKTPKGRPLPGPPVRERARGPYHVNNRLFESRRTGNRSAPPNPKARSTWQAPRSHGDLAVVSQGFGARLQVLPVRSRLTFNTVSGIRTRIARTDRVEKLLRARSGPAAKAAVAPHRFDNASTLPWEEARVSSEMT